VGVTLVNGAGAPGPAFATSVGATRALDEIRRVLDLDALDEARLDALEAEARSRSAGYETVSWIGPTPGDLVDDHAQLMGQMSVDAPMGDLEWEPEAWDAGRLAKVINPRQLRREVPEARRLVSWNAESNTHMVAINDALGFRPVERLAEWVYEIEQP
jgi:hypothetical protein